MTNFPPSQCGVLVWDDLSTATPSNALRHAAGTVLWQRAAGDPDAVYAPLTPNQNGSEG
jgi:hypothetical protein